MAASEILTTGQIDSFIDDGFCRLSGAFTAAQAAAVRQRLWRRMEKKARIRENDPSTWPPNYDIEEHLNHPEVSACFTDRLAGAIEQLVGADRWRGIRSWGLWPVNFSYGADRTDDYPSRGWHIDGNWFRHTIDSPYQGLLVIGLFTDIEPGWGGTILALGSHKRTARVLARQRGGIQHRDLFRAVLSEPLGNFHEITGRAGDVVLAHPFLFHTRGFKRAGPPRIISNTEAGLTRPLRFNRRNLQEYSVLETSILGALLEEPIPPRGAKMCRF
jgi:hypothetical protein